MWLGKRKHKQLVKASLRSETAGVSLSRIFAPKALIFQEGPKFEHSVRLSVCPSVCVSPRNRIFSGSENHRFANRNRENRDLEIIRWRIWTYFWTEILRFPERCARKWGPVWGSENVSQPIWDHFWNRKCLFHRMESRKSGSKSGHFGDVTLEFEPFLKLKLFVSPNGKSKTGSKRGHFGGGMSQMILGPFLESKWFVSPNGKSKKGIKKRDFPNLGPFWESKLLVSPNGKSRIGSKSGIFQMHGEQSSEYLNY